MRRRIGSAFLAQSALVAAASLLFVTPPAFGLQPPREGEIERLRREGTLEPSLAAAKELGNHRVNPRLVTRWQQLQVERGLLPGPVRAGSDSAPDSFPPGWLVLPSTGNVKLFALLIDFDDYAHANDSSVLDARLFGEGSPPGAGYPQESLARYYERSSYGLLSLYQGSTLGWYRFPYSRGGVPQSVAGRQALIREALQYYDQQGHDFSQYDNDGDGYVDYFIVIWTGPPGAWASFWWGYYTGWSEGTTPLTLDGKRLARYSWQWESYNPGGAFDPEVVIHETGHSLGLPDLYDYDSSVGPPGGVGRWDMMDGNAGDHNAFSKWLLDWLTPTVVPQGSATLTLDPSGSSPQAALVMPQGDGLGSFDEYFLVQNRYLAGNDQDPLLSYYLTNGLWIWHIDSRLDPYGGGFQFDNSYAPHKLVRLMEADGLEEIEQNRIMNAGDVYVPGKRLGDGTFPSSARYGGQPTGVLVTDIAGSGPQYSARFSIAGKATGGWEHTLLVESDASLWAWGRGLDGRLGTGDTADANAPVRIGSGADWRFASAGARHSVAVKQDGTLWGWGYNQWGQVGDGTTTTRHAPVRIGAATDWSVALAGSSHSAAIKTDGTLWAWGDNSNGQLGDGTTQQRRSPVQIGTEDAWAFLTLGATHSLAIKADGTLWAWGGNASGQLGDGTTEARRSPVRVGFDNNWAHAAAGSHHSLAIKKDGSLWAWGNNNSYQLGDGTSNASLVPIRIGSAGDWSMVAAGGAHSAAISRDGSLSVWGDNAYGQLGDGSGQLKPTPTRIGTSVNWNYVSAGESHTLAVKTDATLWDTGRNNRGQLGDGSTVNALQFRQLMSTLPTGVTLSAVPASPRQVGALVSFAGDASGGNGSYEYQFWLKTGATWSIRRDYAAQATWDWDTRGLADGTYAVRVHARNAGSVVPLEASASQDYVLLPTAANYTLNVSRLGGGSGTVTSAPAGIDCGTDCTQDYASGTTVTLTAGASAGSVFSGWGGACAGTGSCIVSMTASREVSATFDATPTVDLASLTLSTESVAGCKSVSGKLVLTAPAAAEGVVVTLADTLAAASTPATVKILAGATTKNFTVRTSAVGAEVTGSVQATLGGTTVSRNLTLRPMGLNSVTLSPTTVVGGRSVTGTAKLECQAGPGAVTVDLSSDNAAVASPIAVSIAVPQGQQSATFEVATSAVPSRSYATIAGTANGLTRSKKLTVNVAASVSPTSLRFGSVPVGATSGSLSATLTNNGAVLVAVDDIELTGTSASWFAQTNNCPASLAPDASCTISVTFRPQAAVGKSARLSITTSATSTPLGVSLSGTGI